MISIQQIRADLKEIRYYYSKQKEFDSYSVFVGNIIFEKVKAYNLAIQKAPIRLYELYVALYVQNNSLAALSYDWDLSNDYIKDLNKQLCEYLQEHLLLPTDILSEISKKPIDKGMIE